MSKNFGRALLVQLALTIALLAVVCLPTAALADELTFSSGNFVSGTWAVSSATNVFVRIVGTQDTFIFDFTRPGNLTQVGAPIPARCSTPPNFFFCSDINSGTLTIANPAGQTIFTGTFNGGVVKEFTQNPGAFGMLLINATIGSGTCLAPLAPCEVLPGGLVTLNVNKGANSASMTSGNLISGDAEGDVPITPEVTEIPEPGSLMLLGTGMMGLIATVRRRLRI